MELKVACLICGVFEENSKATTCREDYTKDLLVKDLDLDKHIWYEVKVAKDWYGKEFYD